MTCRETIRMICEYLEGRLSTPVARDLQGHLRRCHDCRMVYEAARRTLNVYFDGEEMAERAKVA